MSGNLSGGWRVYVRAAAFFVVGLYAVGVVGHLVDQALPLVLFLTPGFLLLLGGMVLAPAFAVHGWRFARWVVAAYLFTFLVEAAGVSTGVIFGEYAYGPTLGWAWLGAPLIIGFNWVVTVNGAVAIARRVVPLEKGVGRKAGILLIAGLLATAFDFAMEPVAMRLDYWQWADGVVPLRNYAAWFVTAVLAAAFHPALSGSERELGSHGRLAALLLVAQTLFFLILQLVWLVRGS